MCLSYPVIIYSADFFCNYNIDVFVEVEKVS